MLVAGLSGAVLALMVSISHLWLAAPVQAATWTLAPGW